ncbi:putative receptor-like protein kinase At5g20050 [Carex rostrata]
MATQKLEIITSAIVAVSLPVQFYLTSANLISNNLGTSIFATLLYFAICYLQTNQISTTKWRILMVVLSLFLIILIFANHFYISPWQWEFVSRLINGINAVALEHFLIMRFSHDWRTAVLSAVITTDVVLIFNNRQHSGQFNKIFTVIVSILVYVILTVFHVKQIWDRRRKVAAIASFFVASLMLSIVLSTYWYDKDKLFVSIASIIGCFSLVPWLWLMCAPNIKAWWQIYNAHRTIQDEQYEFLEMAGLPTRFTIQDLETATANFQAPIGEGASGAVFKGTLADGSTIAVKWIKWQPSGETEFRTEMTIIASRQHVNLVHLLGYCISTRGDRYLIYPFHKNGSLDAWIFSDDGKRSCLTWALRYRIAIDVAKALAYLHHECHHRILHLDVKPANILLDGDFRALLSDFGISKLIGKDESSVMTRARGTVGYLAPEMLVPNAISTKSDVYSYGMVLFELVGGRRNLITVMDGETQQRRNSYFPKIVREKMMQGELMEVVDQSLIKNEEIREEEVTILTRLALWCIQENPILRPGMTEVVEMLERRTPVHVPPESSMFVVNFLDGDTHSGAFARGDEEDEAIIMSANTLSISIQSGR